MYTVQLFENKFALGGYKTLQCTVERVFHSKRQHIGIIYVYIPLCFLNTLNSVSCIKLPAESKIGFQNGVSH